MLSVSPAENPFAQALYSGLVIVYLHRFEGTLQLVHQFRIKTAHSIGEFHAERLDARKFLDTDHVLETEVKEVGPQVVLVHLKSFDDVQRQPPDRRIFRQHGLVYQFIE